MSKVNHTKFGDKDGAKKSHRYYLGMLMASCFSMAYFVAPFYILTAIWALVCRYPNFPLAVVYCVPLILSALIRPMRFPWLLKQLQPMCEYFDYEEIHETSPVDVWHQIETEGKNYLCVFQPHGALSFAGICSAVTGRFDLSANEFPTAVADALLVTPILKHIMGIFGLISASKGSMQKYLQKPGAAGCVVLYVGGMAELFLSSETEEILYLKKRKGFIKLALTQGVDIVPVYLFGNTSVLSVLKAGILATMSRKLQMSLTYIWGRFFLPIPRDCKLLYVSGQPLGMPKIDNPTQEDIDKWHQKYCDEVTRLFNSYKERVPEYKHKKLEIV